MTANPTLLSMPLAQNGQKNVIPATQATAGDGLFSQATGFPAETSLPLGAGGKAPTREDFNGAFNLLSDLMFYAQKGWMFNFDAGQSYFAGCIVRDATDGNLYECLNDVAAGGSVPSADSTNWKAFSTGGGVPVGFILPYAAEGLEEGFLECDGSAVSRTMYPDLFAKLGTKWGAGDGSTTFNLPKSEDLVLQGASALNPVGTYKSAGLPNIEGISGLLAYDGNTQHQEISGAFQRVNSEVGWYSAIYSGTGSKKVSFDASQSNPIYGASGTVQSPAACVRFMIKAFDGQTADSALIDVTQYAQDLANRLTREQTPAFNKRDVITTSGTYTAPVTGWYRITVKGGGGGGGGGASSSGSYGGGGGGGEGGTTIAYEHMSAGDTATVVVGAGGTGGSGLNNGSDGGDSSVTVNSNTYTGGGGKGGSNPQLPGDNTICGMGGTGTINGASGVGFKRSESAHPGGNGGGAGGANASMASTQNDGVQGGGGAGGYCYNVTTTGSAGGDGFAWFEYFAAV